MTLTGNGYQVEAFGKCFYYGYEFEPEIDSETRKMYIQYVKFSPSIQKDENLSHFIQKATNDLIDACVAKGLRTPEFIRDDDFQVPCSENRKAD